MKDAYSGVNSNQNVATSKEANLIIQFFTGDSNAYTHALKMIKDVEEPRWNKKRGYFEIDADKFWVYLQLREPYQQAVKGNRTIRKYDFKALIKNKKINSYVELVEAANDYAIRHAMSIKF